MTERGISAPISCGKDDERNFCTQTVGMERCVWLIIEEMMDMDACHTIDAVLGTVCSLSKNHGIDLSAELKAAREKVRAIGDA